MPSSHHTPSIAPRPSGSEVIPSSPTAADSKVLNPRILRKREADRKCQRLIRERTKSRIADLEATVKEYERKDASGLSNLMKQLAEARHERDALAKKVKNIETVLNDGRVIFPDNETLKENSPELNPSRLSDQSAPDSLNGDRGESRHGSFDDGILIDIPPYAREPNPLTILSPFVASQVPEPSNNNIQDTAPIDLPIATDANIIPISGRQDQTCECMEAVQVRARKPPFNIWRYANDVLSSRFQWPVDYNSLVMDDYVDDTPVRVVLEGWDAVERRGSVHPSWQLLKRIDQAIFWRCEPRERLAVLYVMHALFKSHSDPSTSELPNFYRNGPSESDPSSYAINYFAWPGVRQKFFESQHRYCTNDFWTLLTRNLRLLWPYEFRDCYTRNTENGMYTVSPLFRDRISDISNWTMGPDMFQRWPEFHSDIPTFNSIPGSVSNKALTRPFRSLPGQNLSRGPSHRSALIMPASQDVGQDTHRTRPNESETEVQQVAPAVYDQMMWTQVVPPQYNHFGYPINIPTLADNYVPPYA